MKKEKGEGEKAAGASIHPDESDLLGNRLLPAGPQTAKLKSPPLRGATGGKTPQQTTEKSRLLASRRFRRYSQKKSAPIRVICAQNKAAP